MIASHLTIAASEVAEIVAFRALPALAYSFLTKGVQWRSKVLIGVACAALATSRFVWGLLSWRWIFAGYAYWAVAACAVPRVAALVGSKQLTKPAALSLSLVTFLLLPGALWPPAMKTHAMLIGWDLVLSAYSYCIDTASAAQWSLGDCLFFLLVNPSLVYGRRGTRVGPPKLDARGAGRACVGIVALYVGSAVLAPVCVAMQHVEGRSAMPLWMGAAWSRIPLFFLEYSRHSGLASLQIGLLRQLGWAVPERYVWPILASSVPDFWRRWNTYVNQWALRYLFWPMCRARGPDHVTAARVSICLVVTFASLGLFHDLYTYLKVFLVQLQMTEAFTVSGALTVLSLGIDRLYRMWRTRTGLKSEPRRTWALATSVKVCLWAVMVGGIARWWV